MTSISREGVLQFGNPLDHDPEKRYFSKGGRPGDLAARQCQSQPKLKYHERVLPFSQSLKERFRAERLRYSYSVPYSSDCTMPASKLTKRKVSDRKAQKDLSDDDIDMKRSTKPKRVSVPDNPWFASSPSKRWGEFFFLAYSPFWIILCLGIVVPLQLYEFYQELEYLLLGLVCALPCWAVPLVLVGQADSGLPFYRRYWFKANLWIAIFGFVGNYFWTHYFYTVLGATYSFPSYKLNHVPLTTFLLTHSYFLFYHMISNLTIRRLRHAIRDLPSPVRFLIQAVYIVGLSYVTALMEAVTIANFPYYEMVDRKAMYLYGSFFYAIYFFASFPMFFRLDEDPGKPWTLSQTAIDSLAAAMLVTILLDLWRISLGPIVKIPWGASLEQCAAHGLPWLADAGSKILPKIRVQSDLITGPQSL
ncbi:hypothetical protein R1sor_017929 [Riccia sorocarpa]|uniref:Cycloeucalenol cycloisomerase n=1 Tax=Riccia sorocarpa TaxID=122646 RepID=A0ABD3IB16_9MARC